MFSDPRVNIQDKSVETIFNLLNRNGGTFQPEFWQMVFRGVLRPLYDEITFSLQSKKDPPSKKIAQTAYSNLNDLFHIFYDKLESMLSELIEILMNSIQNGQEVIAGFSSNYIPT